MQILRHFKKVRHFKGVFGETNMDSASENESDFEVVFEESETDDDDVPVVDRLWTNVRYVENFEYPHEINPFSRHMHGSCEPSSE